jgi:hypothetical protein
LIFNVIPLNHLSLQTIPGTDGMKYDWYEMDLILTSAV